MSAATAPILRYHQLHSRPSVSTGAPPPRVSVWVHSLLTQHTMLAPVAQAYIDKAAAATGAPWTAVLLDSRCHGASADLGLEPPHNVDSMTDDCMRTLSAGLKQGRWGPPEVLVGHSIGGLIVLELSQRLGAAAAAGGPPELAALGLPRQVWTIDTRALPISADHPLRGEVAGLIAALTAVRQPMGSPAAMVEAVTAFMAAAGVTPAPAWLPDFCRHVLKPDPAGSGGYMRHFDPAALPEMMESFCAKNYSALLKAPPPGCTLHMVRGLASSVWLGDGEIELALIRQQQAAGGGVWVHDIESATHWIPVSHAATMLEDMTGALPELGQ